MLGVTAFRIMYVADNLVYLIVFQVTRYYMLFIVHFTGSDTYCVVADKINLRVRNYMKANKYNIARLEWLVRCIDEKTLLHWLVVLCRDIL